MWEEIVGGKRERDVWEGIVGERERGGGNWCVRVKIANRKKK